VSVRAPLRAPATARATCIAFTSGKGGVGKTSLAVNVGVALARAGYRVGIFDADFALGNVDVMLGLTPEHHLGAVLDGSRTIDEIALEGPAGVRVFPAGSGVRALTELDGSHWRRLTAAVGEVSLSLDFLLLDTATGISNHVVDLLSLADYVVVLTSYDPSAVLDAYATIRLLEANEPGKPIGVVVNTARDAHQGDVVYRQIAIAAERFLHRSLAYDGYILEDRAVRDAALSQIPVIGNDVASTAGTCIRRLARRLLALRIESHGPQLVSMVTAAPGPAAVVAEETSCD